MAGSVLPDAGRFVGSENAIPGLRWNAQTASRANRDDQTQDFWNLLTFIETYQ
jgi:hypothetical protein